MEFSTVYVILTFCLAIISAFQIFIKFDKNSLQTINYFVTIVIICFFGFRGFVGWDWYNYYNFFKTATTISNFKFDSTTYEIGFSIYTSLIKSIDSNYISFVFISSLLDFILLHIFFKRYIPKNMYVFAFLVFLGMEGIVFEINLMRSIKGLLLFLISIQYIEDRSLWKFVFLNSIGLCFHWSSIIFFPLYFFIHKKIDVRLWIIIFIIGNIIYLFQIDFVKPIVLIASSFFNEAVETKTLFYLQNAIYNKPYGITFGYIERIFTTVVLLLYYNNLIRKSKSNIVFVNAYLIFIIIYFYFSEISIIIIRLGNIFIFSYWILWPLIINNSRGAVKYILFAIFVVYLNVKTIKTTNNILYKYDNVLFKRSKSYEERIKIFNANARKLQMN